MLFGIQHATQASLVQGQNKGRRILALHNFAGDPSANKAPGSG